MWMEASSGILPSEVNLFSLNFLCGWPVCRLPLLWCTLLILLHFLLCLLQRMQAFLLWIEASSGICRLEVTFLCECSLALVCRLKLVLVFCPCPLLVRHSLKNASVLKADGSELPFWSCWFLRTVITLELAVSFRRMDENYRGSLILFAGDLLERFAVMDSLLSCSSEWIWEILVEVTIGRLE